MRNLKRALSLALASVMVMGMMVVGTSASYKDVDDADNVEAIEVLQAVGIMVGDDNGNFNPDTKVTRNEMAVIMSNLLNLDYDYYRGVNKFSDVPSWAAPYVAACAAEGVTAGIGNGLYGGSNTITAAQAALMIMKTLGYFQHSEDFGDDWQVATIRQASYIDLFDGINANAETPLTRNQVAQMVLNGLKANMVDFTGDVGLTVNGVSFGYRAEYTARTNAAIKYNSIDTGITNIGKDDKYYVQLGEELYNGDLKLKTATDVFGRPARTWEYDGKEIGTYVNYDLLVKEYTVKVTGKDLYDLLGSATIKDYDLTVVIDGVDDAKINSNIFTAADMNKNNKQGVGATGNGVLTQVFVDTDSKDIIITEINTYLAIADKDYDAKKDELAITAYGVEKKNGEYIKTITSAENKSKFTLDGEDFDIADVAEDDALLVTVADGEVQTISEPTILSEVEITAFKKEDNVTVEGTKYSYSSAAEFNHGDLDNYTGENAAVNLKDTTYNVYLDKYGYAIGVEEVDPADNYLFITGIDKNSSNLGNKTADAAAIFLDGTMETIPVNMSKSTLDTKTTDPDNGTTDADNAILNTWCTYTVDKNGVYTVKEIIKAVDNTTVPGGSANDTKLAQVHETYAGSNGSDNTETMPIDKKNISLAGGGTSGNGFYRVYGNDKTVYLTAELAEIRITGVNNNYAIIDDVASVVTGVKNANLKVWENALALIKAEDAKVSGNVIATTISEGVYTLYKSNGYVIAAVVVGDDGAASKNLVYVTSSSVEQESYDSVADEWTWTREVAVDGQKTELVEVSDAISLLSGMKQDCWYQVKYNAAGHVIEVEDADSTDMDTIMLSILNLSYPHATYNEWDLNTNEYVNDIDDLQAAMNAEDTVLYVQGFTGDHPEMRSNTLFVTTTSTQGFHVSEDANIILRQYNRNKMETTYLTGADDLEDIVNDLNTVNGSSYSYIISAVIENGDATTVVVYDATNTYQRPADEVNLDDTVKSVSLTNGGVATLVLNGLTSEKTDYDYTLYVRAAGQDIYDIAQEGTMTVNSGKSSEAIAIANLTDKASYYLEIGGVKSKVVIYDATNGVTTVSVESVIEAQPASRAEVKTLFSSLDQTKWGRWANLPTVGLTQTVSGSTIKLSGKLDQIDATNYAAHKEDIEQWLGTTAATFNDFITALSNQGYSMTNVDKVGFAGLVVDGKIAVTCVVGMNDGTTRALKGSDATFKWTPSANVGEVTIDVSSLTF